MRLDPKSLASRLELRVDRLVPSIIDCPLCGSSGKLEVRQLTHATCRTCGFVGDFIQLCARKEGRSAEAMLPLLIASGAVDAPGEDRAYLSRIKDREILQQLISRKAEGLLGAPPANLLATLSNLNCRLFTEVPATLRRHMFPLFRGEIEELELALPTEAAEPMKWWGKYGALAVPAYAGPDVAGLWLLTQKGEQYLPLMKLKTAANGFGLMPSMADSHVFIVDSIRTAIRMTVWSAVHRTAPLGFVCPTGLTDLVDSYAAKKCVFWSATDDPAWILRARHSPSNLVVFTEDIGGYSAATFPSGGDFGRFLDDIDRRAVGSHRGAARRLLSLPSAKVATLISNDPIDASDRAKILAYATGEDQRALNRIFTSHQPVTVSWGDSIVTETENGWVARGKPICSVKFYLDKLRPLGDSGDALVSGAVVCGARSMPFEEKLSVLRRNTASWLENFAVSKFGTIVCIAPAWRGRLLELSQQFRRPAPIMPDARYGWEGAVLRMPSFVVDDRAITPLYAPLEGPTLPLPEQLSEADKDAFDNESFCKIFLILLRNMLQTRESAGTGWLLVNQPHVVNNLASAFGHPLVNEPTDALLYAADRDPLPCFGAVSPDGVRRILRSQRPLNTLFSVDTVTAELSQVLTQWPIVNVSHAFDYRCLRGVFYAVHYLLANGASDTISFQSLAREAAACFGKPGKWTNAGITLDCAVSHTPRTPGARCVELFVALHERGVLHPKVTTEGIAVTCDEFYSYSARASVDLPTAKDIRNKLAAAQCLSGYSDSYWAIASDAWMLYAKSPSSLRTAPVSAAP